jgi:hypothetical protein
MGARIACHRVVHPPADAAFQSSRRIDLAVIPEIRTFKHIGLSYKIHFTTKITKLVQKGLYNFARLPRW